MSRKPAHLEMIGGKSPRQRVWEAIRAHDGYWRINDILPARVKRTTAYSYIRSLVKAEYIEQVYDVLADGRGSRYRPAYFVLVNDAGIEAPRLDKDGKAVSAGRGMEAMWHAMRHFLRDFDALQLAAHASTEEHPVSLETAKSLIGILSQAGYLIEVRPFGKSKNKVLWTLDPKMNTGPRPPMIQRTKTIYDPNLGRVVWADDPAWEAV